MPQQTQLDLHDIQGLVARGYGSLEAACYLLFTIVDQAAARTQVGRWAELVANAMSGPPDAAMHIAFTASGLAALGVPEREVSAFSAEFLGGMAAPHRSRQLGDVDEADPARWQWGGPANPRVDGVILLYARDEQELARCERALTGGLAEDGLQLVARLGTERLVDREPFGFRDGISQPFIAEFAHPGAGAGGAGTEAIPLGEFVLGHPNGYGQLTDGPDLARNGSYLVFRQLEQDVAGFWRYVEDATRCSDGSVDDTRREHLAAKMVGRWRSGAPLVLAPDGDEPAHSADNAFGYHRTDPLGLACPLGAHIRRANPRDSLDPDPGSEQSLKVNDRHRLLRRGRSYGPAPQGLHFICLVGNISRQFEFVQHTWLDNPNFRGRYDDTDPLVGSRHPYGDQFTEPADPVRRRYTGLPRFVVPRGGAYFFLPSISALRELAGLP
jgi:Dyp-type peroxidase family